MRTALSIKLISSTFLIMGLLCSGCAVVSVAGSVVSAGATVVSTAVDVSATVVKTGVKVGAKAIDAATD
ncbi:MAG TPA: hypothetical protein VIF82_02415 [Burkholderiaceae bacterium]|jgi:hypothetical protein